MNRTAAPSEPFGTGSRMAVVRDVSALRELDAYEYAVGHALFEARSDQRERLTQWLVTHLQRRADVRPRVLSIGCGDGSVDERVAAALAVPGRHVDYLGIEPHDPSGELFLARLNDLPGVHAATIAGTFDDARLDQLFDVVLAVHSLYYVDDLAMALRRACSLVTPGGELVVMHAPAEPLNGVVRDLAPGQREASSDEVVAHLRADGLDPKVTRIDNRLDLSATGDSQTDRALLAFTLQTHLPPALERTVRAALAEQAMPGPGLVVSHPVDAIVVRR